MNKRIKKVIFWTLGTTLVLFITLIVHLYMVIPDTVQSDTRARTIGRIDFKEPIDSLKALEVRGTVSQIKGVDGVHFNFKDHIFVYSYTIGTLKQEEVFEKVMKLGNFKAEIYKPVIPAGSAKCPLGMDDNSFLGKLSRVLAKLIGK